MSMNGCKSAAVSCKETLYTYNMFHMVKAFFPEAEIRQTVDEEQEPLVNLVLDGGSCFSVMPDQAVLCLTGVDRNERKKQVTRRIYDWLAAYTGKQLAWGTLTGVRPVKLAMNRLKAGDGEEEITAFLQREYQVSEEKARLAAQIAEREKVLLDRLDYKNGFSLYIGIPFCPSICSYCSFSSSPIGLWKDRVEDYLEALFQEIRAIGDMTFGRKPDTVYIGGGTPVTLDASQLDRLLSLAEDTFPEAVSGKGLLEYTVEAGRPDAITREKLEVLRRHEISRISVNPQTMQQKTLDRIGRQHTVEDAVRSFWLARELGFDNINMDLIAGLPGETAADMQDTLRQIEALCPDSLTVHSLAVKRAAQMGQEKSEACNLEHREISRMIQDSADAAKRMGMVPYYLYRQKNIAGNFENVGYARADKAGIYNILIMEEVHTIIACGAGSMSKRVYPDGGIERSENVKDVALYLQKIDEMIERKRKLLED